MKQNLRLLLLTLLCAVCMGAWAADANVTIAYPGGTTTSMTGNNDAALVGLNATKWSVIGSKAGSNFPGLNKDGTIRLYYNENGNNTITISSLEENTITSISITYYSNDVNNGYVEVGGTRVTPSNGVYTINSTSFVIGNANTSNVQVRIKKIVINYTSEIEEVAAPTFTPPSGTYETTQSVTISADQGCEIYYTLDGTTEPTTSSTKYTNAISVSETTTIKAIAVNGESMSEVVTATYTIAQAITVAEARTQATGDVVFTKGIVTSCVGTTAYMQDETAGICVYGKSLTVGDEITVQGTLTEYKGLLEITNPVCTVLSSGNTVTPAVKKISEITNAIQGQLVKIEDATVSSISNKDVTIAQGNNSILVRFNNDSDIKFAANDIITLTGNIGCYNTVQIANPTNVTVKTNEDPTITLDSYAIAVGAEGETKTLNVTYSNFTPEDENIDLVFYATADGATTAECDWITFSVEDGVIELEIDANDGEERKAYFKVHSLDDDDNNIYSNLVTVTQEAEPAAEFADLPFEFDGGKADIEGTDGLTQEGLGTDYNASPKLRFDGTGDWLLLQFNERPGKLTFDIKGNSFSGTFTVQTSEDGETFTDLAAYTELGGTQSKEFSNLGENVRYIKWIYTEKSNGNVALGNIKLEEYVAPESYTLTISENDNAEIFVFYNDPENNYPIIESGDQVLATSEVLVSVSALEGYQIESVTVTKEDGQDVTLTEQEDGISWTFIMPDSKVTVACTVTAAPVYTGNIYEKVTSTDDLTSGTYLIVYEDVANMNLAFDGSLETLDAVGNNIDVTISDNKILGTETIDAATFTIDINGEESTIKSASGYYIGQPLDKNGMITQDIQGELTNTISIAADGNADIVSSGGAYLRYNAASDNDRFRYFKSTTYTSQKAIQLYKLVEPDAITVDITSLGYATLYYSNVDLVVPEGIEAYTYKMNASGDDIETLETYVEGDVIPQNCGVVLKALDEIETTQTFTFAKGTAEAIASESNLLLGLDEDGQTVGPDGSSEGYIFYMLSTKKGKVGFYWKNGGAPFTTMAHKAYLAIPKSSGVNASSFFFDDLNGITAIESDNTESAESVYTLSGIRMDGKQLPKGIYIVNGKKMVIK